MGEILFLAHRIPFPPDRGDKIRSHHLLKTLAAISPVHVGCFGETDADMAVESGLADLATTHCLVRRSKPLVLAGIQALASDKPVSLKAFDSTVLKKWVTRTLADRNIQTIFVFSGQMGQFIPDRFEGRVIVDLCDVDSAKFEAYGQQGSGPKQIIDRREARLMRMEEARLARRADAILLVSENEAELFRSRIDRHLAAKVLPLRNGIDSKKFDPDLVVGDTPFGQEAGGPHLVFTGQMDYQPNVDAAVRAMDRILPAIREEHADTMLHIVGRAPVEQLVRRDGEAGIRVWGEVTDIRPFLASADIVLAPLTIARGIQNKVLEAMAMARPVVLSPEAATGIEAEPGIHFSIGSSDTELVRCVLGLLSDGDYACQMGMAARQYVVENQAWPAMLASLDRIVQGGAERAERHAA